MYAENIVSVWREYCDGMEDVAINYITTCDRMIPGPKAGGILALDGNSKKEKAERHSQGRNVI